MITLLYDSDKFIIEMFNYTQLSLAMSDILISSKNYKPKFSVILKFRNNSFIANKSLFNTDVLSFIKQSELFEMHEINNQFKFIGTPKLLIQLV